MYPREHLPKLTLPMEKELDQKIKIITSCVELRY